jgi:PAS domain S-box-containing protein
MFTLLDGCATYGMKPKISHRIALKLVLRLMLFSVLLTILGTVGQAYVDYRSDVNRVSAALYALSCDPLPDFSRSVKEGDGQAVNSLLDHLMQQRGLAYAAVLVDERIAWQRGRPVEGKTISSSFPLVAETGGSRPYGTLEVMADIKPVWRDLTDRCIRIMVANGIKIFLIAGFTLLMFQYLVTRHLESLAQQIRRVDFTVPGSSLGLDRGTGNQQDELDEVVAGLNSMIDGARLACQTLARNEERLLLFFDATEEAILGVDRAGLCTFANDACLKLLKRHEYEEIIGKELSDILVLSGIKASAGRDAACPVCRVMAEGRSLHCEDSLLTLPGGSTLFVAFRAYPVFKEEEVAGAVVFINDNSEKRRLRRERELLSEAVEQAPVMILIAGRDLRIQYGNSSAERLTGYSRQELVDRSIFLGDQIFAEGGAKFLSAQDRLQAGIPWQGTLETTSKGGQRLQFFSVVSPVLDDRKQVVNLISVAREVSYEIALQNELVNAKKMEAVSRLSGSIAHEFGNPLFAVRSVLRDLSGRETLAEEDKHLLELAHGECERMRTMVREFQQLYRESTAREENRDIATIIAGVVNDTGPILAEYKITCTLGLAEETGGILGNTGKLSLVLRNIIVNALEAMANRGGVLRITTSLTGEFFIISIGDSGRGIKKEHQELVFEPFFSTKTEVEGAGLGLSVAYGTMKSLGGTITFVSEEGNGTVFEIHLPIV